MPKKSRISTLVKNDSLSQKNLRIWVRANLGHLYAGYLA